MNVKEEFSALLPAGIHSQSLTDLEKLCLIAFPESGRRPVLFDGLNRFINQLQSMGIVGSLWIDGSFLTSKSDPTDIDVVLLFDDSNINALSQDVQAQLTQLLDKANAMQRYGIDIYIIDRSDIRWSAYWRGFFGFCRDGRTPKGIAEISL